MNAHDHPAFEGKRTAEVFADLRTYQRTGSFTFATPADFFEFVRGPQQHNQHVETYRGHIWLERRLAAYRNADIAMREHLGMPPRKD
jgi:hypothetical protein